ncbi:MAG TPA: hypothetical protein VM692_10940 [Gammaproteobacteria bacterium]|nr:hypothetical protein [Gammaproteobacteria bacterium]
MYPRTAASVFALGTVLTAASFAGVARAQSNAIAAIPRVAAATQSRAASCNRACLEGWVDRYFAAVIADDPSAVPLAPNVRFTENGQVLPVGEGLWKSMKSAGNYRLPVADPEAGQIALITTVVEDHADPARGVGALLALRLKIVDGRIAEIEQIVERNEMTAQRVEALGTPRAAFSTPIPANQRMSRADLITTANKYFSGMQRNDGKGDYPFGDRCDRIENGGRSTNAPTPAGQTRPDPKTATGYSGQWSCREQFESGLLHFVSRIRDRRYVAVDQERGVVAAFAFFDHMAGSTRNFTRPDGQPTTAGPAQPWTWEILELFKIENGQLAEIEAFLTRPPYGMLSGWSTWEDGMSDKIQEATGYLER